MRTSRFFSLTVCAALTAMLSVAAVEAQPPGGGGGRQRGGFGGQRGGGPTITRATLLGNDDIKDELKIDEGQGVTVAAALDAYRQERNETRMDRSAFEGISDEQRTELFSKMQKDREALTQKTDELLNALLEPEQVARLNEILVQVQMAAGVSGFLKSDDIKAKLSVTEEQVAKLDDAEKTARDAMMKMFEEMRSSFGGRGRGRGDDDGDAEDREARDKAREKSQEMMKQARTKATDAAMAVLTAEQTATLDEMKGKAFEFDVRSLYRRGGGRGGDRGGRGGAGGGRGGDRGGRGDGGGERRRPAADTDDAI